MIRFVALSGFLGAGKTTSMIAAAKRWEAEGKKVSVITNDQSDDLVDTRLAKERVGSVGEVTGGCFCCKFEDLVAVVTDLVERHQPDVVIAESVGSCTDLQATVVRPLRKYYGDTFTVAPLTTIVDPLRFLAFSRVWDRGEPESDMTYLFRQQLEDAEVVAISKTDVVPAEKVAATREAIARHFPHARVVEYSAMTGAGLDDVLGEWGGEAGVGRDLDVDYDRYAAAEAELGWLNLTLDLTAGPTGVIPLAWGRDVLRQIGEECAARDAVVGHAKVTLDSGTGLTKLSITGTGSEPAVDAAVEAPEPGARVFVNARVAVEPAELDDMVARAVADADAAHGTRSQTAETAAFKPGYPTPVHRLTASEAV